MCRRPVRWPSSGSVGEASRRTSYLIGRRCRNCPPTAPKVSQYPHRLVFSRQRVAPTCRRDSRITLQSTPTAHNAEMHLSRPGRLMFLLWMRKPVSVTTRSWADWPAFTFESWMPTKLITCSYECIEHTIKDGVSASKRSRDPHLPNDGGLGAWHLLVTQKADASQRHYPPRLYILVS